MPDHTQEVERLVTPDERLELAAVRPTTSKPLGWSGVRAEHLIDPAAACNAGARFCRSMAAVLREAGAWWGRQFSSGADEELVDSVDAGGDIAWQSLFTESP
jgi:hypothetical protein